MSAITSSSGSYNNLYFKTQQESEVVPTTTEETVTEPSIMDLTANLTDDEREEFYGNLQDDASGSLSDYNDKKSKGLDALGKSLTGN